MEPVNLLLPALRPDTPGLLRRTGGLLEAVRGIQQDSKSYWFNKGVSYKEAEEWNEAVFCFDKIANEQRDWQTHLLQGYCSCRAERFAESLISLRKFALEFTDKADFVSQARNIFPYQKKLYPRQCATLLIYGLFETETKVYDNGSRSDDYHVRYEYIFNVKPLIEQDRLLIALLLMMAEDGYSSSFTGKLIQEILNGVISESLEFEKARLSLWLQEHLIEKGCYEGDDCGCWLVFDCLEDVFHEKGPNLVESYKKLLTFRDNISIKARIISVCKHIEDYSLLVK